jgi:hypothetical protein
MLGRVQQVGLATGQHACSEHGMGLDHLVLLGREPAGLQQDGVGNRDLAEIVQRRCLAHQPDRTVVVAKAAREPCCEVAHALGVLVRVVVAILGGRRKPAQQIDAHFLEIAAAADGLGRHHRLELDLASAQRTAIDQRPQPARGRGVERRPVGREVLERHHLGPAVQAERVEARAERRGVGADDHDSGRRILRNRRRNVGRIGRAGGRNGAREGDHSPQLSDRGGVVPS